MNGVIKSIADSIKNRKEVLSDLEYYEVDEKYRPQLEENLKYFEDILDKKKRKQHESR